MEEVIPYARRFTFRVDVEALVRSTPVCWEYPMCDRDPCRIGAMAASRCSATPPIRCIR